MSAESNDHRGIDGSSNRLVILRGAEPATRRRRMIFVAIYGMVAAMLTWPLFPRFAGVKPLIFGLPLSFAWVVAALVIMFGALVWLYSTEDHERTKDHGSS